MIFSELLHKKKKDIDRILISFFEQAQKNQNHHQDLLLTILLARFNKENEQHEFYNLKKNSFFVESTQHEFFSTYHDTSVDYYKKIHPHLKSQKEFYEYMQLTQSENDIKLEEMSIQIELMIYLKIWETRAFIRRLVQIFNLHEAKNFNWDLKIDYASTELKMISNKTQKTELQELIKDIYKSSLRNAIAHSEFFIENRKIYLTNLPKDIEQIKTEYSFEEWAILYHSTALLYKKFLESVESYYDFYVKLANDKELHFLDRSKKQQKIIFVDKQWKLTL